METSTAGKTVVAATIENLEDLYRANQGVIPPEQVRRVDVVDALIDTGASGLRLPRWMIEQLGLLPLRTRQAGTMAGPRSRATYRAVRLTIHGRDCISDVAEVGDEFPVLVGQVPLELLDWIVDPRAAA